MKKFSDYHNSELWQAYGSFADNPPTTADQWMTHQALEDEMSARGLLPGIGRAAAPNAIGNHFQQPSVTRPPQTNGFRNMGEFALAVRHAGIQPRRSCRITPPRDLSERHDPRRDDLARPRRLPGTGETGRRGGPPPQPRIVR